MHLKTGQLTEGILNDTAHINQNYDSLFIEMIENRSESEVYAMVVKGSYKPPPQGGW
jgi:hypothetical protein